MADTASFEPVAIEPQYPPPRASIDPDRSKGWLRRVWPLVAAQRAVLIGSLALALVALGAQVAAPAVLAAAIDSSLVDGSAPLGPFVVALIALGVARGLFAGAYRYGLATMALRIETDLRATLYRHLTQLSFGFYDRVQSGQIISRANSDIRSVQMVLAFAPLMGLSILMFVLAFGIMLRIDVPLTLLAVAPLPVVYLLGVRLRNQVFPLSWITQARAADLATIVDENVHGVRVVKSFAQEQRQLEQLARSAQRLRWANIVTVDTRSRYAPIMENLPRLGLVVVLLYGGWLVIEGRLELGILVAFNAYILMMQTPFRVLGFFMMLTQRAAASAERIFEILDEAPEVVQRPDAADLIAPHGAVALRDVHFGYGDGPDVLRGVDLDIAAGETVALVGRTGSGKSTLARLIGRFYDVRSGTVHIDGTDVRDVSLVSLRAAIGLVLDEPFLFSASVHDNIAYGRPDATRAEVTAAARAALAHEFVTALPEGYDTIVGERGYTLSGGQRQRIAIARTLLVNPPLVILDDATSAIDVGVESQIHDALDALLAHRTTLVIAHRLSTIALASRVVLLVDGRVAATGTHAELMANEPRYAAVLAHATEDER